MADILIIDENTTDRRATAAGLTALGHRVEDLPLRRVGAVLSDLSRDTHDRPDIVVLDPDAPDVDGLLILRLLRMGARRPVVVTAAGRTDAQIARVLDAGADSYAAKPCSPELLDSQITAILRRVPGPAPSATRVVGQLRLDTGAREVTLRGEAVRLTQSEFDLLACLSDRPGRELSRAALVARLWPGRPATAPRSVDFLLSRLRAKLGETAQQPCYLHSSRSRGVALRAPRH
ncbi:response regulator transcription factor [Longispora sp. NPDC051575]|uniref:response regulator transcription factor n=1 Tax=Longispora sp. NPDC051575 TaxID=3154943 RepID=UPI00343FDC45